MLETISRKCNFCVVTKHRMLTKESSVTIDLEWEKPTQTFGDLQGYRVRYGPKGEVLEEIRLEGSGTSSHKIQKLGKFFEAVV